MPPPPLQTQQYLTILMTGRGGAIIFCRILAPLNAPLPQTQQYLTILMTGRGGALICRILAPPPPPPSPHTQQYLTSLMTERGGAIIFCRNLAPPSPDAAILNYLNDRELEGAQLSFVGFWRPPPPPPQTPQYLTILKTGRGMALIAISC